jgi:hypothetical protein
MDGSRRTPWESSREQRTAGPNESYEIWNGAPRSRVRRDSLPLRGPQSALDGCARHSSGETERLTPAQRHRVH